MQETYIRWTEILKEDEIIYVPAFQRKPQLTFWFVFF